MELIVEAYYGSQGTLPLPKRVHVAICTIEKANVLVNHLIEESRLNEIGCIVCDELHMLAENDRGLFWLMIFHTQRVNSGSFVS